MPDGGDVDPPLQHWSVIFWVVGRCQATRIIQCDSSALVVSSLKTPSTTLTGLLGLVELAERLRLGKRGVFVERILAWMAR